MNDAEFGRRIAQRLNQSLREIDPTTLDRLQEARTRALSQHSVTQAQWNTAAGNASQGGSVGGGAASAGRFGGRSSHHHSPRMWLGIAAIAVLAAMASVSYWQQSQRDSDQGALDAAMLSDELPLHAFTHSDFKAWLNESR